MGLADTAIGGIADSLSFRASAAPYLLLDVDLQIRAANAAYQRATDHDVSAMVGEAMFDVFPDNPRTPEARGVQLLGESFERALRTGGADRMGLQRYDVIAGTGGGFVHKTWLPINSAIRDQDGQIIGLLHHVEDVTHLLTATALELDLLAPHGSGRPRVPAGTPSQVAAIREDLRERRARGSRAIQDSHRALARMSRRIATDRPPQG